MLRVPVSPEAIVRRSAVVRCSAALLAVVCLLLSAQSPGRLLQAGDAQRIPWTNPRMTGYPDPPAPWTTQRVFEQLALRQPVCIRAEPGTNRYFLIDHQGAHAGPGGLHAFDNRPDVDTLTSLLTTDRLIYGFCFHPQYVENGFLFTISNGPVEAASRQNRITRYTVDRSPDGRILDGSERVILEFDSNGHNGGDLAFGPDGMLYCPTGDGTSDSDTLVTGQGLNDLLAVMLRLDVDHPDPGKSYAVPPDNPYVGVEGARPEIWATGFRNPWRMDYDHQSNQLWVGQNGQDLWEQVYLVHKGENYGWSLTEGSHPFHSQRVPGPQPITPPTAEHSHAESRSLTGGVVHRGSKYPELNGMYLYGDYSTGKIWGIRHDGERVTFQRELADTTLQITGFANGHEGELLVVDHGGAIHELIPNTQSDESARFPRTLRDTGLFVSVPDHSLIPAAVPYSVNSPLWSDGAHKERWLIVPGEEKIQYTSSRGWTFPNGSVLVKSFAMDREAGNPASRVWIETRILLRQHNEWVGYSYRWNDEQTDGTLVASSGLDVEFARPDGSDADAQRIVNWHYPSRAECMYCHSRAANYVLGLTEFQMNREQLYADGPRNQIERLASMGYFTEPLPRPVSEMKQLCDPLDSRQDLTTRARSYLHANCSGCHVEAGGGNSAFSIEFDAPDDQNKLFDANPVHSSLGIPDAKVIVSGNAERSLVYQRMSRRGHAQMPPIGTGLVDKQGIELIRTWIEQLEPQPVPAGPASPPPP